MVSRTCVNNGHRGANINGDEINVGAKAPIYYSSTEYREVNGYMGEVYLGTIAPRNQNNNNEFRVVNEYVSESNVGAKAPIYYSSAEHLEPAEYFINYKAEACKQIIRKKHRVETLEHIEPENHTG